MSPLDKPLIIPMMMFGKFRQYRSKRDKDGNVIKDKNGRNKMERYWKVHSKEDGDPGVYPSVNHIYVRMGRGAQRLSDPARDLLEEWSVLAEVWKNETDWEIAKDKVVLEITVHFPNDNRKRDTHNVLKLMMDAFEGVLYENDNTALPRIMDFKKVKGSEDPYFEIHIYSKENENDIIREKHKSLKYSKE